MNENSNVVRLRHPAIEAVGIPVTFELCQKLVAPGGTIANIGVHGKKVDLHLEQLWDRNISITTRLVDTVTIPMLFKTIGAHKIDPKCLITHRFKLDKIPDVYETFGNAAKTKALKVIIEAQARLQRDRPAPLGAGRVRRQAIFVPEYISAKNRSFRCSRYAACQSLFAHSLVASLS